ncbi:MAG: UvrD-helicase domain-containing protein [Acidobacteria bacterium]|nr:UvrD-helicase domain-containing protein [Acidobacteriota bacterium]
MTREAAAIRHEDERARALARRAFDRPLLLEAGAGTGKTATLVARLVSWCLGPGWERSEAALPGVASTADAIAARVLSRIVAITFTERAAVEMSTKLAEALAALHGGREVTGLPAGELPVVPIERAARAAALLAQLHRLQIGTIHAYCRRLLAAWPLEAGLRPGFEVDADGSRLRACIDDVLAETIPVAYGEPGDDAFVALATAGLGPPELADALEALALAAVPPAALDTDPCSPEVVAATHERLRRLVREVLELIGECLRGNVRNASALRVDLSALARTLDAPLDAPALAACGSALSSGAATKLRDWADGKFSNTEKQCLGAHVAALPQPCLQLARLLKHLAQVDPELLWHARAALRGLLGEVERRMRAEGAIGFQGLLREACRLVESNVDVRGAIRRSIDQLLVDEFQDTDPLQCRIVEAIALDGDPADRPGLFVVGDPKQSIYGWRSADLAAYDAFRGRIAAAGGEVLRLSVNFRSVPAILDEVARITEPLLVAEPGVQAGFQPLLASDANAAREGCREGGRFEVEHWVSWDRALEDPTGTGSDRAREIEAEAVARDIAELHGAAASWGRAAILLRSTTQLETYLRALREAGVPYVVERDRNYYRRREVIDASSLVQAVADPNDHVALLGYIRSPWVGTPDAALVPLWGGQFPDMVSRLRSPGATDLLARIDACVEEAAARVAGRVPGIERIPGWPAALRAGVRALAELRRSLEADAADVFVEKARGLVLAEETEAARHLGAHRLANLERFFRRLLDALGAGTGGAQAVLRELRRGVAGEYEEEEGGAPDETLAAVRVMTIHKAKGLTFDDVYLVNLHGALRRGEEAGGTEAAHLDGGWRLRLMGIPGFDFDRVVAHRERVAAAEESRTLYVAVTRPRRRLVLAGLRGAAGRNRGRGSHAELLRSRDIAPPGDATLLEAAADTPARDAAGVIWRVPAGAGEPGPPDERPLPEPIELARATADVAWLREARDAARARMSRPFTQAVTALTHGPLERLLDEPAEDDDEDAAPALTRDAALALGTAVHRVLETFDFGADPREETRRQAARLERLLSASLGPESLEQARVAARDLVQRLRSNGLLARLARLAPHVIGREVPLLLTRGGGRGPVGAFVGSIDLLYRDPANGEIVVADFKTDPVEGPELAARARAYAAQGELYLDAVRAAWPGPARFELWFLHAGEVVAGGGSLGPA